MHAYARSNRRSSAAVVAWIWSIASWLTATPVAGHERRAVEHHRSPHDLHPGMAVIAQAIGAFLTSVQRANVEPDILMHSH